MKLVETSLSLADGLFFLILGMTKCSSFWESTLLYLRLHSGYASQP